MGIRETTIIGCIKYRGFTGIYSARLVRCDLLTQSGLAKEDSLGFRVWGFGFRV